MLASGGADSSGNGREFVASLLRDVIAEGAFGPGDRLPPERRLATALGVSRPALREGIRRLASEGVLESRQGSGNYVADVDPSALSEVRIRLEPLAARLAAANAVDAERTNLLLRLDELATKLGNPTAFAAAELGTHRAIAAMSGNPILEHLLENLTFLTRLSRLITVAELRHRQRTFDDIEAIVRAIVARDAQAAERGMVRHLRRVARRDLAPAARPGESGSAAPEANAAATDRGLSESVGGRQRSRRHRTSD